MLTEKRCNYIGGVVITSSTYEPVHEVMDVYLFAMSCYIAYDVQLLSFLFDM